jgi:hypothetical protein
MWFTVEQKRHKSFGGLKYEVGCDVTMATKARDLL